MLTGLLIKRIEGRILTGIVIFVVIMILVGWVAINEPGRMAAFVEQQQGRSIERGAELYAANCSTCHGVDGRGIVNRAPGLNNPHLFGFDPFAAIISELTNVNALVQGLETEREGLINEIAQGVDEERQQEIVTRVGEIDTQLAPAREERDALVEQLNNRLDQLEPAIASGYLPGSMELDPSADDYNEQFINLLNKHVARASQVSWAGDLNSYIFTTLVHGRPGSNDVWPDPMVAWSQRAGGPLRDDQIQDIANYILNWDKGAGWTIEDFAAVQQYAKLHADAELIAAGAADSGAEAVGTAVEAVLTTLADIEGDASRGEAIYNAQERTAFQQRLGCAGCHAGGAQAPATEGTWDRVINERLNDPALAGYTPEQYIVESILLPGAYIVSGYSDGIMPAIYGEQLNAQDLADLLAFLRATGAE